MRSVGWRARAVLLVAAITFPRGAAVAAPRVAFANAAEMDRGAKTVIESLRPGLIQDGYENVPAGPLRDALEAPLAASEDRLAQSRTLLVEAKDAYAGFEYEEALASLTRVDNLLASQPHSDKLVEILAERYVLEGLVHAGARNEKRAEAAFAVVKRLRPERALDPATYHPRIVALFNRAGDRPGPEVDVRIDTTPGARVLLNGREIGKAPAALSLARGVNHISVAAEGFEPVGRIVNVTAKTTEIPIPMVAAPAESRARRLRDELRASESAQEIHAAAARLCALAEADVLVIVRNREGATFEAAVYRCAPRDLADWVPIPSAQFFAALGPANPASATRSPDRRRLTTPPPETVRKKRSWYRTWWGTGLIAGAAAAVGTAAYFAFRPQDEFVITGWCVGEECNP